MGTRPDSDAVEAPVKHWLRKRSCIEKQTTIRLLKLYIFLKLIFIKGVNNRSNLQKDNFWDYTLSTFLGKKL